MRLVTMMSFVLTLVFFNPVLADNTRSNTIQHTLNFQFQIQSHQTKRQGGQTLSVYIRYALKDGLDESAYPDYIPMRKRVLSYLEPSEKFPENLYWEVIVQHIGNELFQNYPVKGVSVQVMVFPNDSGKYPEPGFHGPVYSIGQIKDLDVQPPIDRASVQ